MVGKGYLFLVAHYQLIPDLFIHLSVWEHPKVFKFKRCVSPVFRKKEWYIRRKINPLANELRIVGQLLKPGESSRINVRLAKLPSGTTIDLPVYIFRSKRKGPTILLSGGLHGDEINGIEIIRRLIDEDHLASPAKGSIVAVPVMNIFGFLNFSRDVPDGKDVNRSFPGSPSGSLAARIAYFITKNILPAIDFGIDFHTGGASRFNFPQIRYAAKDPKAFALAKTFEAPLILQSGLLNHSLRKEAFKMGKTILVFEGGESMRIDEEVVEAGMNGALRVLYHHGLLHDQPPKGEESAHCEQSKWVRAKRSGIYKGQVHSGTLVNKGDILGVITDPFGEFSMKVKAPSSGIVVGHNNMPVVNQGDALIHLGVT
jgi:hypothetical protein